MENGIMKLNKKFIFIFIIAFFVHAQAFMGSFYTATLYPKENTNEVIELLHGKHFFICSADDDYNLVTEKRMDEQNTQRITNFVKRLSTKVNKPIISYMIYDSDVLWFTIYENGKQIFIFDNSDEYFNNGKFIKAERINIPELFKIDEAQWKKEITINKFKKCGFADDFLITLLKVLKMPTWVESVGYTYLAEDDFFVAELEDEGIKIVEY